MGRNWNEQERVGRGADDDGVGDQNVVDSDVDNNCDQSGERHDRENDGVAQAPFLMVAIAVAAQKTRQQCRDNERGGVRRNAEEGEGMGSIGVV